MNKFVEVDAPMFTDPWDRSKEYPILPGELCILCEDDSNIDKNQYAIVLDVTPSEKEKGNAFFLIQLFNRDDNIQHIKMFQQKDLLFIPWVEEEGNEYNHFVTHHMDIVEWAKSIREERKNEG